MQELRQIMGFDEVEEIAAYMLTIESSAEVSSYLTEMLGDAAVGARFANALAAKRAELARTVPKTAPAPAVPAPNAVSAPAQQTASAKGGRLSQKERKKQAREQAEAGGGGFKKKGGMAAPVKVAGGTGGRGAGNAKVGAVVGGANGGSKGRSSGGAAPARYTNCLHCGKIEDQDRIVCSFCGQELIWDPAERAAAARDLAISGVSAGLSAGAAGFGQGGAYDRDDANEEGKLANAPQRGSSRSSSASASKSASQQQELDLKAMERKVATSKDAAGREAALDQAEALRAKLLHFDRTSAARSKVYDDQADYYTEAADVWNDKSERDAARNKADARREANLYSRRQVRVQFDIAGRRVLADDRDDGRYEGMDSGSESSDEERDAAAAAAAAAETDAIFAELRGELAPWRDEGEGTSGNSGRDTLMTGPLAQYSCLPAEDTSSAPETLAGAGLKTEMLGNKRALSNNALTGRAREVFDAIRASAPDGGSQQPRPNVALGRRLQHEVAF